MTKKSRITAGIGLLLVAATVISWCLVRHRRLSAQALGGADRQAAEDAGIELRNGSLESLRISPAAMAELHLAMCEVKPAPPPEPLKLTGSLLLDPNRLVRIHSRFSGELVSLGTVAARDARPDDAARGDGDQPSGAPVEQRPIRYGDRVTENELLAIISSKDVGEKKSELVDAISRRDIDHSLLSQYEQVPQVIPGRTVHEARRNYQGDEIAVARAERTLRSWRLTEENVQAIHEDAKRLQRRQSTDPAEDSSWAEIEVRSPIAGLIVEKNFNVGDIVDPTQDLFKIADLSHILVVANAYEEDLPLLRALPPEQRTWRIDIKADPNDVPIAGKFDIIGNIIDPSVHAGAVMGSVDNPTGRFSIGEFVTVTIDRPPDPSLVLVPTAALVEQGGVTRVFVETAAEQHEFALRRVLVVNRGRERSYIRSQPSDAQRERGAGSLVAGQKIVGAGAVALAARLESLPGDAEH